MKTGQYDAAESIFFQYLHDHPDSLNVKLGLAEIALKRHDFKGAETYLLQSWHTHRNSLILAIAISRMFAMRIEYYDSSYADSAEDMSLAKGFLDNAAKISPEHFMVLTQTGKLALLKNDYVEAEHYLQQALNKNPAYVPAIQGLIQFYLANRDLSAARDTAMHALELDPNDSDTLFYIAQLLDKADQPSEAIRYALKSERMDAARLPARNELLATQYDKLGNSKQALYYYKLVLHDWPNDPQLWLKMGDLQERLGDTAASIDARRQALTLDPTLLDGMREKAREAGRTEQIPAALKAWRDILVLQPSSISFGTAPPEVVQRMVRAETEAQGAIAGLHLLARFLHPGQTPKGVEDDQKLILTPNSAPGASAAGDDIILNSTKLDLAATPVEKADIIRETLEAMEKSPNHAQSGEAAFLLESPEKTKEAMEQVDGLSAEDYTILADRLAFDQEFIYSHLFYQRAYELNKDPRLLAAMKRIQAKQILANNIIQEGNALYEDKQYEQALRRYRQARVIDRESGTVYLRLADTYEKLHQWTEAKQAYDMAVALSPGLLHSKGFSQHYAMLKHKASMPLSNKKKLAPPVELKPLEPTPKK